MSSDFDQNRFISSTPHIICREAMGARDRGVWRFGCSETTTAPARSLQDPDADANLSTRPTIFPLSSSGTFMAVSLLQYTRNLTNEHQFQSFAYLSYPFTCFSVPHVHGFRFHLIANSPVRLLLTRQPSDPSDRRPIASLCTYAPRTMTWEDVHSQGRHLLSSAAALLDDWLYVAGGYAEDHQDDSSEFLTSAERLSLITWKWQPRAFGSGVNHMGKFVVIGGGIDNYHNSAEIYNPMTNTWRFVPTLVPGEPHDLTAASFRGYLFVLAWSATVEDVELYILGESDDCVLTALFCLGIPYQPRERALLFQFGATMLKVGTDIWVMIKDGEQVCQVDGICAWPYFPSTSRVLHHQSVTVKGHVRAISFTFTPDRKFNSVLRLIPWVGCEGMSFDNKCKPIA